MKSGATDQIETCPSFPIFLIRPAVVNDSVYKPISLKHPDASLIELSRDIATLGILEPIVLTSDHVIVSGHRRHAAAQLAGFDYVPVRLLHHLSSTDAKFLGTLIAFNNQREKTLDEVLRELTLKASDPEEAHRSLREFREHKATIEVATVAIIGTKGRSRISSAKEPFMQAIRKVLTDMRAFLPLSVRQIHYQLLNDPPLMHSQKQDSRYRNSQACYKQLSELLTRARVAKMISMDAIADETRPFFQWPVHKSARDFAAHELKQFMREYRRDTQQSQPNHIEVVGEKNTLSSIVKPVVYEYGVPYTTGRGFCSTPPKAQMAERFRRSGKERLILLMLSDFDPEGEEIAHSFARDLRDEHGVTKIEPIKVALKIDQVRSLNLVPSMEAKEKSVNYQKFVSKFGTNVFELEAVPPETLQQMLRDAIESVLDIDAWNHEVNEEKKDAAYLEDLRERVKLAISGELNEVPVQ